MDPRIQNILTTKNILIFASGILSVVFVYLDFWLHNFDVPNSTVYLPLVLGLATAPYFGWQYLEFKRIKAIEQKFPEFLRTLAEAQRSGITITNSILASQKVDYGALMPEIKRMSAQLSWGIPFPHVVRSLQQRLQASVFVRRAMTIVMEAYSAGGDVAEAMEAVATNAVLVKDLEAERQSKLSEQVLVMYVIFFIFLGMIIVLHKILGPLYTLQLAQANAGGGGFFGLGDASSQFGPSYYRRIFLHMSIIQAVFSGLLAGQLGEGTVVAGFKHAVVMLVVGVAIFTVSLPPESVLIDISSPLLLLTPGQNYEIAGNAYFSDGSPIIAGQITIELEEARYKNIVTGTSGEFAYRIKAPEVAGKYTALISVDDGTGKKGSTKLEVTVSAEEV